MSETPKLDAKTSLCWTCKHGLCVQETGIQTMMHEPTVDKMQPKDVLDSFGEFEDDELTEGPSVEMPILEHVTVHSVQAICYWRPPTVQNSTPIRVSQVTQCNRYEKS